MWCLPSVSHPSQPPPPPGGPFSIHRRGVLYSAPPLTLKPKPVLSLWIYICRMSSSSLEGWGRGGLIGYIHIRILHTSGYKYSLSPGSFYYDIVWERASHLQITMHLLIFVCLWVDVTLTAYYVNNLNGLRNMLS